MARVVRFGAFEIDLDAGELRKSGLKLRLQEQPFQILSVLLEKPGEVVSRDDLRKRLWPDDTFGDFDHGLNTAINKLRETLGDTADRPRYVETVPRRGYRFIGVVEAPAVATPTAPPVDLTPWRRQRAALTIALAIAVCAAVAALVFRPDASVDRPVERFTFVPEDGAVTPVISPDGRRIAYISGSGQQARLMVQDLDRFAPREVAGSAGALWFPSWSPDSRQLVFAAGDNVWRVPATGGQPALICQFKEYLGSAWRPDGSSLLLFGDRVGIHEVAPTGGVPRQIFPVRDPRWGTHFEHPWFLTGEDDDVLLYTAQTREGGHVSVIHSMKTGKQEIVAPGAWASWSPTGHIVYASQWILWGQPFLRRSMKATGEAFPIATDVGFGLSVSPSVSRDGTLVYCQDDRKWRLQWLDENGGRTPIPGTEVRSSWWSIALSPDPRTAAISIGTVSGDAEIWLQDLSRGTRTRLATRSSPRAPVWHPSGKSIAFQTNQRGNWDILSMPVDGSGPASELVATPLDEEPMDWSHDGNILLYRVRPEQAGKSDIWYLDTQRASRHPVPFLQSPAQENFGVFSPDGRFLAYASDESGRFEVYLQRFPEGGDRRQVSVNGGNGPRWRKDGKELFFHEELDIVAVPVKLDPTVSFGAARRISKASSVILNPHVRQYDISPDGRRILLAQPDSETARPVIRVVRNWFAEFKDRK